MILLRPTYYHGRYLWQVVAVDREGRERVLCPPVSKELARKVAVWAVSRPISTFFAPSPSQKAG